MYPDRTSTKAVIIKNDALLVILGRGETGDEYFYLPGGGQEKFETLEDNLKRECLEEIDARVMVGDLLVVRDYISKNHEFAAIDPDFHQVDFFFECTPETGQIPKNGASPDSTQLGVHWLPPIDLETANFYPAKLRTVLLARDRVYLGDVN